MCDTGERGLKFFKPSEMMEQIRFGCVTTHATRRGLGPRIERLADVGVSWDIVLLQIFIITVTCAVSVINFLAYSNFWILDAMSFSMLTFF